jgi:hypothetical protein
MKSIALFLAHLDELGSVGREWPGSGNIRLLNENR